MIKVNDLTKNENFIGSLDEIFESKNLDFKRSNEKMEDKREFVKNYFENRCLNPILETIECYCDDYCDECECSGDDCECDNCDCDNCSCDLEEEVETPCGECENCVKEKNMSNTEINKFIKSHNDTLLSLDLSGIERKVLNAKKFDENENGIFDVSNEFNFKTIMKYFEENLNFDLNPIYEAYNQSKKGKTKNKNKIILICKTIAGVKYPVGMKILKTTKNKKK